MVSSNFPSQSSDTRSNGFGSRSNPDHFSQRQETPIKGDRLPSSDSIHPSKNRPEEDPREDKQSEDKQDVIVTLLLAEGHEYKVCLRQNAPSLKQLFAVLMEPVEKRHRRLFQLPVQATDSIQDKHGSPAAALCFTGDRLIGLITDPPIYIQHSNQQIEAQSESDQSPPNTHPQETSKNTHYAVMVSPERERSLAAGVIPSRYIQLTHFLQPDLHDQVLEYAIRQEKSFVGSSTSTGDLDYRQSSVLHYFPEFSDIMQGEIHRAFADVIAALKLNPFTISQVEAQLTAHNDGHYYKIHNDNGSEDTATRVLTYVYYFYQTPKPFSGGKLRIYDSRIQNNYYVESESFQDVTPINNSIVFFPSHYMHEVLPIICPSQQFADSRFTINGWVRH